MRRFLLVVAVAIAAVTASAQELLPLHGESALMPVDENVNMAENPQQTAKIVAPKKTVTPTGNTEWYSLSGWILSDWYGLKKQSDVAEQIAFDGNDVYFKSLFPDYSSKLWTKGVIEGDSIVIPRDQTLMTVDYWGDGSTILDFRPALYAYCKDSITIIPNRDLAFKMDGDRIYFDDDPNDPHYAIGLAAYKGETYMGLWSYGLAYDFQKVTADLTTVEVPSTAKTSYHTFAFKSPSGDASNILGTVAVDGNDVYFDKLTNGQGWVKGTREGNTVTIPSGQYLGASTGKFLYFNATSGNVTDEGGSTTTFDNKLDALVLTVDGDDYKQTGAEYATVMTPSGYVHTSATNFSIVTYNGPQPAIPADPEDVSYYVRKDEGFVVMWCSIPLVDVDGNYISQDYLEAAVYVDGEIFTFTPEDGYGIDEDMTWVKAHWYDRTGSMMNFWAATAPVFWVKVDIFNEIGIQLRYTVGGIANYSNIVYKCSDGTTHTVYTGIKDVNAKAKDANVMYNIAGQRVNSNAKGLIIKNGKTYLNM